MRKRRSARTETYGSVVLYRDDFTELLDLLNSYVFSVTLSDKEYEYENLEEVQRKRGDVIRHLQITGHGSESTLILEIPATASGARLEVVNSDEVFLNVQDFIKKRRRMTLVYLLGVFFSLSLTTSVLSMVLSQRAKWVIPSIILFSTSAVLFRLWFGGLFSRIYLTNRHQAPSFWKRNKDALLIIVITAVVTGLISILVSYLLFKQGIK